MKSTLIITTFNWVEALELVLISLLDQQKLPTEIIIADDGSTVETAQLVNDYSSKFAVPLIHVWHENKGFRRSVILNKAIAKATGDYIIQLDGDCIMHPKYIFDHLQFSQKNTYLFGSRVNIKKEGMAKILQTRTTVFSFFSRNIRNKTRNIHSNLLSRLYKPNKQLSKKIRGCNLSYWKSDFIAINGYNEDMTGWGREDSEMVARLLNKGVQGRRIRYRAIIYHLWHEVSSKASLNINETIQNEAILNKIVKCKNGIDKYLNEN